MVGIIAGVYGIVLGLALGIACGRVARALFGVTDGPFLGACAGVAFAIALVVGLAMIGTAWSRGRVSSLLLAVQGFVSHGGRRRSWMTRTTVASCTKLEPSTSSVIANCNGGLQPKPKD